VWAFWVVGNVLCIGLAALQILSMFSEEGVFEVLVLVRCGIAIAVHVVTFRTLRDAEVKRYVMT
jgi:hypothetical protein